MKKPLLIFGTGQIAQLAHYYFSSDSDFEVLAFTVDAEHLDVQEFCGLPVLPFEGIRQHYSPESVHFFAALSYAKLNQVRKSKYLAAKALGYRIASYISTKATVLNDGQIGENCFVLEDNTIQPFAAIGDNVTLWSGNHIGHHARIDDHCFITSHVVVSGGVHIGESCFVGVNATLRDHIDIGAFCVIGAGALMLADAQAHGVYVGTAAQRAKVPSSRLRKL